MQKLPDRLVVSGSAVRHRQRVHARSPEDGVLVGYQLGDQRVRLLEATVHRERYANGEAAQDFLVLTLTSVLEQKKIFLHQKFYDEFPQK